MASSADNTQGTAQGANVPGTIGNRTEKKTRKALEKQGLEFVPGITRVTMRRPKGVIVSIQTPEVYKSAGSNTYIVFGDARVDDMAAKMQQEAMSRMGQQMPTPGASASQSKPKAPITAEEIFSGVESASQNTTESADDLNIQPATGTSEEDINVVMSQANVSRSKAIKALNDNNGDLVEAIMSLM